MSVQQVKDRFQELTAYLGRDATGLEKVRKLKDAVNVIRTSLASAREQLDVSATTKQMVLDRAVSAETELSDAKLEIHSLRQQLENLKRDLKEAEQQTKKDDVVKELDRGVLTNVMKRLRKRMRYCPEMARSRQPVSHLVPVYNRDDFAEGWSHDALWTLGASVAMLCLNGNQVIVQGNEQMIEHDEEHEGFHRNFVQWFSSRNVDTTSTRRDVKAGIVRLRNVEAGALKQVHAEMEAENLQRAHSRVGVPIV